MSKNKRDNKEDVQSKNDSQVDESQFSDTVKARRERLAREVGDASEEFDTKSYGTSGRQKREDEK